MKLRKICKKVGCFLMATVICVSLMPFGNTAHATDSTHGMWTEWSETYPDSDVDKIETRTQYMYRDKSTTTDGHDTLSGWTKYDSSTSNSTSSYVIGTPISTTTQYSGGKKIVKSAVDVGNYYYAYGAANPNSTSEWDWYVTTSHDGLVSYLKSKYSSATVWAEGRLRYFWYVSTTKSDSTASMKGSVNYNNDGTIKKGTSVATGKYNYDNKMWLLGKCYKVKTTTTTNYFYKWGEWTSWSDTAVTASTNREVKTRTLYRYMKLDTQSINCESSLNITCGEAPVRIRATAVTALSYSSDNNSVASVSADGTVTPNGVGTARITVKACGTSQYKEATKTITVSVQAADQSISGVNSIYNKTLTNDMFTLSAVAKTALSYSSDNNSVASVSNDGVVKINGIGTANITINAVATPQYNAASKIVKVIVEKDSQAIHVGQSSYTKTYGCDSFNLDASAKTNLSYASSNTSVAKVAEDGEIDIVGIGTTTITVTADESDTYKGSTKKISITSKVDKPIFTAKNSGKNKLTFRWSEVAGAKSYTLALYKRNSSGNYKLIKKKTGYGTSLNYKSKTVKKGSVFKASITANCSINGKSYKSKSVSKIVKITK